VLSILVKLGLCAPGPFHPTLQTGGAALWYLKVVLMSDYLWIGSRAGSLSVGQRFILNMSLPDEFADT